MKPNNLDTTGLNKPVPEASNPDPSTKISQQNEPDTQAVNYNLFIGGLNQ
jgi:RNA recognition motif-containing protein